MPEEQQKKPCPDCGKVVTWLADGSRPRQHKCQGEAGAESNDGVTINAVIKAFIETRDEISRLEAELKEAIAPLKAFQEKRQKWLMGKMTSMGTDKVGNREVGTAFIVSKASSRVVDGEAYKSWVHEDWEARKHFIENRVSKTAVEQHKEEHCALPPGVDYITFTEVQIRRA